MSRSLKFVSMCGDWVTEKDWFDRCATTWHRLLRGKPLTVMNDGGFSDRGKTRIEMASGIQVERVTVSDQVEREFERSFPVLGSLRKQSPLMRKLTDLHFYFDEDSEVLFFDSDIFVRRFVKLPESLPEFAYCVDDVPGYTGKPSAAFRSSMVRGLNSGFIVIKMAALDLGFLEHVAGQFLRKFRRLWWVEQTCWALLGGRLRDVRVFANESIEIVSGFDHRDDAMRRNDQTCYLPRKHPACTDEDIQRRISGTGIVHFAGPGKPWIALAEVDPSDEVVELRMKAAPKMSSFEKGKLFARLALQR